MAQERKKERKRIRKEREREEREERKREKREKRETKRGREYVKREKERKRTRESREQSRERELAWAPVLEATKLLECSSHRRDARWYSGLSGSNGSDELNCEMRLTTANNKYLVGIYI